MKPKNFPARKLVRQLRAQGKDIADYKTELSQAQSIKSKKKRG